MSSFAPSAPPPSSNPQFNSIAPGQPKYTAHAPGLEALQAILQKYEITIADANDLVLLQDYEIVFIADDSGSMQLCSVPPNERRLGAQMPSRWDELCETIRVVSELACCFDADGIDIHFLNRPSVRNITSVRDPRLVQALAAPPAGTTPLTEKVQTVLREHAQTEKPVLMMIATDGEPNSGPQKFKNVIRNAINKTDGCTFKFQILACTEDDDQVAWLNEFDDATEGLDVTDDYYSERKEVLAAGRVSTFKRSDWVIKALLGPISSKYDKLDQRPTYGHQTFNPSRSAKNDGCCLVM